MNSVLKGIIYVAFGASSYGMLATFVKLAYQQGYTTAEVTSSQYVFAILCLLAFHFYMRSKPQPAATRRDIGKLVLSGTSMGFTSVLYYLSVRYINASIAVVLLMQSVWIGVMIESLVEKSKISPLKIAAVVLVLAGTVLAANILKNELVFDLKGYLFGFLAAVSFSLTLYSTNSVAKHLHAYKRSLFMLFGGAFVVLVFTMFTQILPAYFNAQFIPPEFMFTKPFDTTILYTWGILLSVLGTVLPPVLLNKGFPLTGVGLGSIVSALELPVSVTCAYIFLSEQVSLVQWTGILIILTAIIMINWNLVFKK